MVLTTVTLIIEEGKINKGSHESLIRNLSRALI